MAWMSERETARYGKRVIVEWREAGKHRSKPFPASKQGRADARFFKASLERAERLGQMSSELLGSEQPLRDFILAEWWVKYAKARLKPGTLADYEIRLDKWVVSYIGDLRLRDVTREAIDGWVASMRADGAGAPTINKNLAVLQGIMARAVEWHRVPANPVVGVSRLKHVRGVGINARTPETIEQIRARMAAAHTLEDATLVSVLAYLGVRPAEAYVLEWPDIIGPNGKPRARIRIIRSISGTELSTPKTRRGHRQVEVFAPVARDLLELHVARGRPRHGLVFPDDRGGPQRRQNWRQRVWIPALAAIWPCPACEATGQVEGQCCVECRLSPKAKRGTGCSAYFRPYDSRHTCATLLAYSGRTVTEIAAQLGHEDPGFTLREYTHILDDARHRRQIPIEDAITAARRKVRAKTA